MIIDLPRFAALERPYWTELQTIIDRLERDPETKLNLEEARRFHYLYERTASDLARVATFSGERETHAYLESLVARAYAEIHESRSKPKRLHPLDWLLKTFPQTFRKQWVFFQLALAITLAGVLLGGFAIALDPTAKQVILPFSHLQGNPSDRVAQEEQATKDHLAGHKATFSSYLMTHNIHVSIMTLALGITYGLGSMILLFYNGVILGGVITDYCLSGQITFLTGWLLPHGSVEIPAILIAGQAGLLLAGGHVGTRHEIC